MALDADALVTLADARLQLKKADGENADDAFIEDLINRASDYVEAHTGQKFSSQTITDRYQDGHGLETLLLEPWPVISVTNIYVDGGRIFSGDTAILPWDSVTRMGQYIIDLNSGLVSRIDGGTFPYGVATVRASWVAGYATAPGPVKQAVLLLVDKWFDERETSAGGGAVKSETVGSYSVTYDTASAGKDGDAIMTKVHELLEPYVNQTLAAGQRPFYTRTV